MEEYLRYLVSSLGKIEIQERAFCCCFILMNEDEVIMKEVLPDEEEDQETKCPLQKHLFSKENIQRSEDKLESWDVQSFPKYLHLRKSSTIGNEYGVWSNMEIPRGTRFGPYEGIYVKEDEADQNGYLFWKLMEDKDIDCFVDENEDETNWLRYVNFAPDQGQQNLIILQYNGQIYYETIGDIASDTELLVWCAPLLGTERNDAGKTRGDVFEKRFIQGTINVQQCKSSAYHAPEETSIPCEVWETRFLQKSQLEQHKHIHTTEKIYACDICEKSFTRKGVLKQHKCIHTGEKPYPCEICGKTFVQKCHLKRHKYTHTGERPYSCETCGKAFVLKSDLNRHTFMHTGEKPNACEICGKAFVRKSHLKRHKYTHTGERPYACETCGKAFVLNSDLKRHKFVHTEEKPNSCEMCGKTFIRKSHLRRHQYTHTGERPYVCETCGRAFVARNRLNQHKCTHTGCL